MHAPCDYLFFLAIGMHDYHFNVQFEELLIEIYAPYHVSIIFMHWLQILSHVGKTVDSYAEEEYVKRIFDVIDKSQKLYPSSFNRQQKQLRDQNTICTLVSNLIQIASHRDRHEVRHVHSTVALI